MYSRTLLVDTVSGGGDPVVVDEDSPAVVDGQLGSVPEPQPGLPGPGGSVGHLPALDPSLPRPPPTTHLSHRPAVDILRPDTLLRLLRQDWLRQRKTTAASEDEPVPAGAQMGPVGEGAEHGVHTEPRPPVNIALSPWLATGEGGEDGLPHLALEEEAEDSRGQPRRESHD